MTNAFKKKKTCVNFCMLCSVSGQDAPNKQAQRDLNPSNQLTCAVTNSNLFSICSPISPTGSNRHSHNSDTNQSDPDAQDSLSEDKSDRGMTEGWKDEVKGGENTEGRDMNEEQRRDGEESQGEDVTEGRGAGEMKGALVAQTTDTASGAENNQRSAEDVEDTRHPETETKDRAEAAGTDGEEERAKTGPHMPEVQIPVQTAADTTAEESDTQRVVDIRRTETPLAAGALSDRSQNVSQEAGEKVEDSSGVTDGCETRRARPFCPEEHQSVGYGPSSAALGVQRLAGDEANAFTRGEVFEKTTEEMPVDNSAARIASELCGSRTAVLPADSANIQKLKQTQNTKQTEKCEPHMWKDKLMETVDEAFTPVAQHECGQKTSPVTADDLGELNKREAQSSADPAQQPVGQSNLEDVCAGIRNDGTDLESDAEAARCQEHMKNEKVADAEDAHASKSGAVTMLSTYSSHENDAWPQTCGATCYKWSPAKEMLLDDTNVLPGNMSYRSAFDWGSTQRKALSSRTKSDVSVLHQFGQVSHFSNASMTNQWPSEDPLCHCRACFYLQL